MDALTRKMKPVCPLCNTVHPKQHYSAFVDGKFLQVADVGRMPFDGLYLCMYCPEDDTHFTKLYSREYKYIGWMLDTEIPF